MMVGALDIRETTTSAATSYAILTGAEDKKMFTPASVLASTAKIFDGIQRAVVTTRTPDTNAAAKLAAVMTEDVSGLAGKRKEIGRAPCRERVCQSVENSVVAVSLKKKKQRF